MAKFKISLLTSVNNNNTSSFVKTILTDFTQTIDQNITRNNRYNYTYDENFSSHQNAQKELTFKMDRKILQSNEWIVNPFSSAIHNGSIIALEDKYNHLHCFVVTKISYTFNNLNITYNYTCQDAFSYQYTRQQSGYTISNDISSADFIGAKTIDWWVKNKIKPECYITYDYVDINQGLFKVYDNNNRIRYESAYSVDNIQNAAKIEVIKEPFTNKDYQTPISFSCSNSNANAALISLGSELSLMLHTYEALDEKSQLITFFWFEPQQNQDVSGLMYSPSRNISNFGLDFTSDSLTTILNVEGTQIGDDFVTLLPEVPSFFSNFLMNSEYWENTQYVPNFFTNLVQGKTWIYYKDNIYNTNNCELPKTDIVNQQVAVQQFEITINDGKDSEGNNIIHYYKVNTIELNNNMISNLYNLWTDSINNESYTNIVYTDNNNVINYDGRIHSGFLLIQDINEKYYLINEDIAVDNNVLTKENIKKCYWCINLQAITSLSPIQTIAILPISYLQFYLRSYRNFTVEESEFAHIADECPWLENKLIDFSFFLDNGIITRSEYSQLMSILQNDLRIVNGKLLYLTKNYYKAVREQMNLIADLTAKTDELGAVLSSDIIQPASEDKKIDNTKVIQLYDNLFNTTDINHRILDRNNLVSEYFNKYFNAEQNYLKNLYLFKKYFNDRFDVVSENSKLYESVIHTNAVDSNNNIYDRFVSFGEPAFELITNTNWNANKPIFQYINNKYIKYNDVNQSNFTNFYIPHTIAGSITQVNSSESYKKDNLYLLKEADYQYLFAEILRNDVKKIKSSDGNIYCQLDENELKRLILRQNQDKYYYRNTNTYTKFNDVKKINSTPLNATVLGQYISWLLMPQCQSYINIQSFKNEESYFNWNIPNLNMWEYYKAFFPVDKLYFYGAKINFSKSQSNNNQTLYTINWDPTKKYYQPITFAPQGTILENWGDYLTNEGKKAKEASINNFPYYTLNAGDPVWATLTASASAAALGLSSVLGPVSLGIMAILGLTAALINSGLTDENNCRWLNNFNTARSVEGDGKQVHALIDNSTYVKYDSKFANFINNSANIDAMTERLNAWYALYSSNLVNPHNQSWFNDNVEVESNVSNASVPLNTNLYQYFNFYQYIIPSYSFDHTDASGDNIYVKDSYLYPLSNNTIINTKDKYIRILTFKDGVNYLQDSFYENYITPQKHFSALTFYPLAQSGESISIQYNIFNKLQNKTLNAYVTALLKNSNLSLEYDQQSHEFIIKDSSKIIGKYLFCRVENYKTAPIAWIYDSLNQIYKISDNERTDLLDIPGILGTLKEISVDGNKTTVYVLHAQDENLELISSVTDWNSVKNSSFYTRVEDKYYRVYTKEQIQNLQQNTEFYYLTNVSKTVTNIQSTEPNHFTVNVYLCELKQKNNVINFESQKYEYSYELIFDNKVCKKTLTTKNGIDYIIDMSLEIAKTITLSTMTNGNFWFTYHDSDINELFRYAAAIELELDTYWNQALVNSKYCQYFLPNTWKNTDTTDNFSRSVIIPNLETGDATTNNTIINGITLNPQYVPNIYMYTNNEYTVNTYQHQLPKYTWRYKTANIQLNGTENYTAAAKMDILSNNTAILNILNHLNTTLDEWEVLEQGVCNYYYIDPTNIKIYTWKDMITTYGNTNACGNIDGIYGMFYFILYNNYSDLNMDDYKNVQETKRKIWNQIYTDYPFIMLEDNYKYDLATTSTDLFNMAQLVFKGKKQPERNYSISLIDINSLKGYRGQELVPGQGIQINANEYYDENDSIYNALKQYLFITDVSYSLRNDADINITVNNIKYQEKLLQSLVKLIR